MKDYTDFEAEDFALDDSFLKWVKHPEITENTSFWKNWLQQHPHKLEEINEARRLIQAVTHEEQFTSPRTLWQQIEKTVAFDKSIKKPKKLTSKIVLGCIVVIYLISVQLYYRSIQQNQPIASNDLFETINNKESQPINLTLDDGSIISLKPGSTLHYKQHFNDSLREVYLEGEGFFEIAKDPQKPFLVHTGDVITKVLGTSFTVRAFHNEPEVCVEVVTGKVSVFEQSHTADKKQREGVVLVPNQQAIYSKKELRFTKTLVKKPVVLESAKNLSFKFENTPMKEVFSRLEEAYGIEIIFDEDSMINCYLNASLSDESLQKKILLICRAVNATYEVIDTHIIIYGKGCND